MKGATCCIHILVSPHLWHIRISALVQQLSLKRLITGEILLLKLRGCDQIWLHDEDYMHLFIHTLYIDTPQSALIHSHGI